MKSRLKRVEVQPDTRLYVFKNNYEIDGSRITNTSDCYAQVFSVNALPANGQYYI